ncbi:MAG TPA: FtsX-like permease family protein, partial [Jatrophihabitans sp.]|nr:FtsX-like permease family protein [Jatrophihabitans sp.]
GVQFGTGHDPETAVAKADPHGTWAMAAATWTAEGGADGGPTITGPVLGLQADRLPAVGYAVRGQMTPRQIERAITVPGAAPASFTGTQIRVTLTGLAFSGEAPAVRIAVRRVHEHSQYFRVGPLQPGRHDYTAAVNCRDGCAFTGVAFDPSFDATTPMTASLTIDAVDAGSGGTWRPVPVDLHRAAAWRSAEVGLGTSVRVRPAAGGAVRADVRSTDRGSPVLEYAEAPEELPVVAGRKAMSDPSHLSGSLVDYAGDEARYAVRRYDVPLPVVLDGGALVNLDYLRIRVLGFDREAEWSVWLGPHAPSDAVQRLTAAGLIVQDRTTESARQATLGRQGPALGLLLLLACAIAAAVLAVGGTAVAVLADARRRSFELAALRVVGVGRRTLRRSAVAEQLLLLGAAVLLGLPSGYVAARLVLPVVPEFSDPTPVTLRYSPPVLIALATAAALAVLLWIAAVVAGWALARAAVPARLREAAR